MNVKTIIQEYAALQSQTEALQKQIAELQVQKKRIELQMEEIEEGIKSDMLGANMKRATVAGWKINISTSTSTVIEAEDELPEQFWRTVKSPDLMRVKEAIKLGQSVPGAILIERQNISLRKTDNKPEIIGV